MDFSLHSQRRNPFPNVGRGLAPAAFYSMESVCNGGTKAPPYHKIRRFVGSSPASQNLLDPVGATIGFPSMCHPERGNAERFGVELLRLQMSKSARRYAEAGSIKDYRYLFSAK